MKGETVRCREGNKWANKLIWECVVSEIALCGLLAGSPCLCTNCWAEKCCKLCSACRKLFFFHDGDENVVFFCLFFWMMGTNWSSASETVACAWSTNWAASSVVLHIVKGKLQLLLAFLQNTHSNFYFKSLKHFSTFSRCGYYLVCAQRSSKFQRHIVKCVIFFI